MKELHSGKAEGGTRVVKLMYKNRSGVLPGGGGGGHSSLPPAGLCWTDSTPTDSTVLWTLVGGPGWLW